MTVYVRCGQDNDSVELIEVLCSCAHTGRSLLVSFQTLYEVVRKTGWYKTTPRHPGGAESVPRQWDGLFHWQLHGAFCVALEGKEPASMGTGNGEESSTKKGSWSTDGSRSRHRINDTLSYSQQTWETNIPSPTAALNSPRSSFESSL